MKNFALLALVLSLGTVTLDASASEPQIAREWRCRGKSLSAPQLAQIDVSIQYPDWVKPARPFVHLDLQRSRTLSWEDLGVHVVFGASDGAQITPLADGGAELHASWAVGQVDPFEGPYESYLSMKFASDGKSAEAYFAYEHLTDSFSLSCVPN